MGTGTRGLSSFGRWLAKAGAELLADADLIVPVPLYPARLWWRRFNQSAMLAREVARLAGVPVDCFTLKRVRRTASQVGLSAEQWRRNVRGAFKVERARRDRIKGRNIVVVDDVITTGATAEACARALKRAGAAQGRRAGARARRRPRDVRALAAKPDSSWPGLSRPSTSLRAARLKFVDARHKAGHDED